MEANEALRRIFWRHRWLLLACLVLPVLAVVPLRGRGVVTYSATAKIQAQSAAPDADTQVQAILSRVSAVATDPSLVQRAITSAKVSRSALEVAQHEISVTVLGSSAVVLLTVTDARRAVASMLAASLARAVVSDLNELGAETDQALSGLDASYKQLTSIRSGLTRDLSSADAAREPATSAQVQSWITQLSAVEQQIANNRSSVQQLLTSNSASAAVISVPTYTTGVSRHVAVYGALTGLVGLLIGLLLAALHELIWPTVAEPSAAARELGVVLLGTARSGRRGVGDFDDVLPINLGLAAYRLGARTLVLSGPIPGAQLNALAERLNDVLLGRPSDDATTSTVHWPAESTSSEALSWAEASQSSIARKAKRPPRVLEVTTPYVRDVESLESVPTVLALPNVTPVAHPDVPALVVVLPPFAPQAAVDRATDLGVTTGWPIIGVIGLRRQRGRWRQRPSHWARRGASSDSSFTGLWDARSSTHPTADAESEGSVQLGAAR